MSGRCASTARDAAGAGKVAMAKLPHTRSQICANGTGLLGGEYFIGSCIAPHGKKIPNVRNWVGSRHPIYAVLQPYPLLLFRRNQFRLFDIINPSQRSRVAD
jgi:hypothetical protein